MKSIIKKYLMIFGLMVVSFISLKEAEANKDVTIEFLRDVG